MSAFTKPQGWRGLTAALAVASALLLGGCVEDYSSGYGGYSGYSGYSGYGYDSWRSGYAPAPAYAYQPPTYVQAPPRGYYTYEWVPDRDRNRDRDRADRDRRRDNDRDR